MAFPDAQVLAQGRDVDEGRELTERTIAGLGFAGRVHAEPDLIQARRAMVADWAEVYASDPTVRMLSATTQEVDALNAEARRTLASRSNLGPVVAGTPGFELRAGDAVICTRNDHRLGVLNGTRGTVQSGGPAGGVNISTRCGSIDLPASYLAEGHLAYGYATTIHKSQGETIRPRLRAGNARPLPGGRLRGSQPGTCPDRPVCGWRDVRRCS